MVRNSQFAIRNSQFAIRNSQFAIRNSQFAIRNSQFAILIKLCGKVRQLQLFSKNPQFPLFLIIQYGIFSYWALSIQILFSLLFCTVLMEINLWL